MPELPEVATICSELLVKLKGKIITNVILRRDKLRWVIPKEIRSIALNKQIIDVDRRAKYLLVNIGCGNIILHLGMSGHLNFVELDTRVGKHDHIDILLDYNQILRFNDPRRFGCLLWQPIGTVHTLLKNLGIEPLSEQFNGKYLFNCSRTRKTNIKSFLMDQHIVVGIGNIYAAEVLFFANILPSREAKSLTYSECNTLALTIKEILTAAIAFGGTTFRDFTHSDGKSGKFQNCLAVYGRSGEPCIRCNQLLSVSKLCNRSVVWCNNCQK